jgi:hypothetical protein
MTSTIKQYLFANALIKSSEFKHSGKLVLTPNQYQYLGEKFNIKFNENDLVISTGPPLDYIDMDQKLVNFHKEQLYFAGSFIAGAILMFILKK